MRAKATKVVSAAEAKNGQEEGDEMIDLDVLLELLKDLEVRGNLKVARPKDTTALVALLQEYDAGGDGVLRMQQREWRVFLHDVVIDPSEFMGATVQKLARDVHNAQVEAAHLNKAISTAHSDLRALIQLRKNAKVVSH